LRRNSIHTERDIRLITVDQTTLLAVSCDSSGAIGSKPLDVVKCSPYTVGKFAARVALMEILAIGANPVCISTTFAVEPNPTGRSIIRGVKAEMKKAGLDARTPIVDSTEKNFKVRQTGAGVTVVGLASAKTIKIGCCAAGDDVFAVGLPCVGREVLAGERRQLVADTSDVRKLFASLLVHEVIPVGSRGILYEAQVLARDSALRFKRDYDLCLDLTKSGGPGTVVLFTCSKQIEEAGISKPVNHIGTLHR
jgi:hypothetical protein